MANRLIQLINNHQTIRYLIVGIYNVGFTYLAFSLLFLIYEKYIGIQWVYWISAVLGIVNGFFFQKTFVWRVKGSWKKQIAKFVLMNLVVSAINSLALFILVTKLMLNPYITQLLITLVLVICSYFISKLWIFKRGH